MESISYIDNYKHFKQQPVNKKLAFYQSSKIYKAAVYDPDALHFWSRSNTSVIVWACIIYGVGEIVGEAIQQRYVAR